MIDSHAILSALNAPEIKVKGGIFFIHTVPKDFLAFPLD